MPPCVGLRHAAVAMVRLPERVDPALAAELLADWGFLADPDLPELAEARAALGQS